jgi:hypothetical protein
LLLLLIGCIAVGEKVGRLMVLLLLLLLLGLLLQTA